MPPGADVGLSFNETVLAVTEFLEVAIHTILYLREVYPADVFVRRKKYEATVYQSRHPVLNEYISGAVKAVAEEMVQCTVDKAIVVIRDGEDVALERFIFSVRTMLEIPPHDRDLPIEGAMTPMSLPSYFRSFLVKLSMVEGQLQPLSLEERASFAIVLELSGDVPPTASKNGDAPPWMPAVLQHTTAGIGDESELHVVRAVNTGVIDISLTAQESEAKLTRQRRKQNGLDKGKGRAID